MPACAISWKSLIVLLAVSNSVLAQQWIPLGPFEAPVVLNERDASLKSARGIGRVGKLVFLENSMLLCTPYGGVFQKNDAGENWDSLGFKGLLTGGVADIVAVPGNPQRLIAVTGDADCILDPNGPGMNSESCQSRGIVSSSDGGRSWTGPIGRWYDASGNLQTDFWKYPSLKVCRRLWIHPKKPRVIMVILYTCSYKTRKYDGYVYRSVDGGLNWYPVLFVPDGQIKDLEVHPLNPKIIYVSGKTVHWTRNTGKSWQSLQQNGLPADSVTGRCEMAVSKSAPDRLYVLAGNRKTKSNDLYIAEKPGTLFTKVCSGNASPEWRTALAVDQFNPDLIYFSAGNKVNRFEKAGASWRAAYAGGAIHDDLHDLAAHPSRQAVYASTDGGLYVSQDSGRTWKDLSKNLNVAEAWGIAVSQQSDEYGLRLLVGTQDCGTILFDTLSGMAQPWKIVRGGDGMKPAIHPVRRDVFYHTDGNSNLNSRSADAGASWKSLNVPRGQKAAYVRPFLMDPTNPDVLYTGYSSIYRSADSGMTWQKLSISEAAEKNFHIVAIAVAPGYPDIIYAAFSEPAWSDQPTGKLFRTGDGGKTWEDITGGLRGVCWSSVSTIAVKPGAPDVVVVGFRGGWSVKAMRSEKGGRGADAWQNISGNLPADADVNSLLYDPGSVSSTLYAATHRGVWSIAEGKKSWVNISANMPEVLVCDLDIDVKSGILAAGTHARGIWVLRLGKIR